jgi:DeoR/GlpR family transcriptional regulator of sugar metabolism
MIGQLAAGYVKAGDIIFVDAGTTAVKMIPHLAGKGRITVVTAGLGAIVEAVKLPEVTLISFGGAYDAHTNSFSGVNAVENLRKINISKAFLSATAVSIEHGLSSNSYLEAEIKGLMFEKVCRRFLLADSSKLDTTATISFAGLTDIDVFVTDRRPPERYVKFFRAQPHRAVRGRHGVVRFSGRLDPSGAAIILFLGRECYEESQSWRSRLRRNRPASGRRRRASGGHGARRHRRYRPDPVHPRA